MLWELADYLKKKTVTTVIPALRNLFSSARGFAGLLLVMLIMQILLSVICIFGIDNIISQQTVLNDFKALISSSEDIAAEELPSIETAFSSTSIFIGATLIWGACALTVYQKVAFASADRDKYIWGMLITHGAKLKKIRGMLKCELYAPHLIATAAGYPAALWLCNYAMGKHGYGYDFSLLTLVVILALSYICIRLAVEYETLVIRRMSCTDLLREEDAPKSICFPRKHSRLVKGFTSKRYALSSFSRMRKYYISLAAIAAVPAVIWICFYVSATGEDIYLSSDVDEFNVKLSDGITKKELDAIISKELGSLEGVSAVNGGAEYEAARIYTHILSDGSRFSDTNDTPFLTNIYADNSFILTCADAAFARATGFTPSGVRIGTVTVISPISSDDYPLAEGDEIIFAVSKLDGSVRAVADNVELLRTEARDGCDYVTLTVNDHVYLSDGTLSSMGLLSVDRTYFLLNEVDYKAITSISPSSFRCEISSSDVTYKKQTSSDGSFDISIPTASIPLILNVGDTVSINGSFEMSYKLTEIPKEGDNTPTVWENSFKANFDYARINAVSSENGITTLNVTPMYVHTVEAGFGPFPSVRLAFGTKSFECDSLNYCVATVGDRLELIGGAVEISDSDTVSFLASSAVTGAEVGTHTVLPTKLLRDTDRALLLEELYGDNSFTLVCDDALSKERYGYGATVKEGTALLMLPSDAYHHYAFEAGDKLRLAVTLEDAANYSADSKTAYGDYDTLLDHMKRNKYDYVPCYVSDIVYSEDIDAPYVFVNTEDFVKIINKKAPYLSLTVTVDAGLEGERYVSLREEIYEWARSRQYPARVSSTGEFVRHMLRKNANYSTALTLIGSIIPLIVPFIWYYPLSTLFDRRRAELSLLDAMGKKKRTVNAIFFTEGTLVALLGGLTVAILCYPAMFIFKFIAEKCSLPLEFEYSNLTLPVLLAAALFSAVCAAVSFAVCRRATLTGRKKLRKPRNTYGNT